ncbi:MAG: protein kinase [Fibrobacter sp.]|nr:protein kinase [Fibrobacter sp.]
MDVRNLPDEQIVSSPEIETVLSISQSDPFIGKKIGNCEILEKINEGGTAFIYRAHNVHFGLERVVKILKPSLIDDKEFFIRFQQEAQLVARFDHPNILRVFDAGQVGGYFYIEMEHITGKTLREYIQTNAKIGEREILSIAVQIVNALQYAHNICFQGPQNEEIHGILHRDIKPENIMLTPGKFVKLMDFGAAKPLNITSNTMQGMIVGTFHYMSPEQLAGEKLDVRSDFFSLGIVLYELATGQRPFAAENLSELIEKIKTCKYPRVRQCRSSISPLTEELIDRLLSRNPSHRPSSAKDISEMLQHCIHSYETWGTGKKVIVPFSMKRQFPVISLFFSIIALVLSSISFYKGMKADIPVPRFFESASIPLLEQGRVSERKQQWEAAVSAYKMVPSIEKGGLANEYLEAQIRMAVIMIKYQKQYNKARRILEGLKRSYSDPAIDAYLGRTYYHLGLFKEARERFESALKSTAGSVIEQTKRFKREIYYYSAGVIDGMYLQEEQNRAYLVEAIKAWDFYLEFSDCNSESQETECAFAQKRRQELSEAIKN